MVEIISQDYESGIDKNIELPQDHPLKRGKLDGRAFFGFLTGDTQSDFFNGGRYTSEREHSDYIVGVQSGIHTLVHERLRGQDLPEDGEDGINMKAVQVVDALSRFHSALTGEVSPLEMAQRAKAAYGALGANRLFNFPQPPQGNT